MYRFHPKYFEEFKSFASHNLGSLHPVRERKRRFDKWIKIFYTYDQKTKFSDLDDLRKKHNARYNDIMKNIRLDLKNKDFKYTKDVSRFVSQVRFSSAN